MRLFTAIDLCPDVLLRLDRLLVALRPEAKIHWSPIDNLHITIKFIGQWPSERLPEVEAALERVKAVVEPFTLELENLGWFPNERASRVFWAGVRECPALHALAERTETALQGLGVPKEGRSFSPHLTLARIRQPAALDALKRTVNSIQPLHLGHCEVSRFTLYESQTGSNGSLYRRVREYQFGSSVAATI
jgi:2'-5' RNA ligase